MVKRKVKFEFRLQKWIPLGRLHRFRHLTQMIEHFAKIVRGDEPPPNFLYELKDIHKGGLQAIGDRI